MLSEEEIIETIKNFDKETKKIKEERSPYDEIKFKKILIYLSEEHYSIFADLLDLYEKEKEKNKNKDKILRNIREEFLKYDWKDANPIQTYNQIKSLYERIYCKPYED